MKRLTPDERTTILAMIRAGVPSAEIEERTGRTAGTIRNLKTYHGLTKPVDSRIEKQRRVIREKWETTSAGIIGSELNIEICSHCHPFFTGEQRFIDSAGRIDRFRKKYAGLNK